jgi:hypothetical protein
MSDDPMTWSISAPRLPAELTDIRVIVDFLHDDEESLANCSFVCKDWLAAARYHIFRKLLLHPWNVEAFVNLIAQPLATVDIVPYVHHLVIDQVKFRHIELFHSIFLRLRPFDFVRKLELRNMRWSNYRTPSIDSLVSAHENVTDLTLDFIIFDNPTDLWSLVARFPSLQRLSVANPAFFIKLSQLAPGLDVTDIRRHLRPPKLRDLVLCEAGDHQTHILEWFSSRGTLIDSLSVDRESFALPTLNQYLQVLGPSLLFLQIDVCFSLAGAWSSLFATRQVLLIQPRTQRHSFHS